MSNWVECKDYGSGQAIYINLDVVVCVSSNGRSTVVTYAPGEAGQIEVEGQPKDLLTSQVVH